MAYGKKSGDGGVAQLKSQLDRGETGCLYVFYGEEGYLKRHYLQRLRALCDGPFADFNTVLLDGEQVTVEALTDAADSIPLGTQKKLVVVRDYKLMQPTGPLKEFLPEFLSSLPEYLCLVFYFDTIEFKPDKRTNLWKVLDSCGQVVEFSQSTAASLIPWVKRHFAQRGKTIETPECEYLLFYCGASMENLVTEIDKIASGTEGERILQSDIDALGSRAMDATVFQLTDSLLEGQYGKGLTILRDLFDQKQEPIAILAAITKQMQRIYGAKLAAGQRKGPEETAKLLGLSSSYPAKLALQSARRCGLPYLRWAQSACLEADLAMKSNLPDSQRTLELLILRFAEASR